MVCGLCWECWAVGLAGALALLNDRKELAQPVQWAGRTNDMRPEKLMGLEDVYTGGRQERPLDARVEAALTRRDEFGRVLTPKESFRQLCYKYVLSIICNLEPLTWVLMTVTKGVVADDCHYSLPWGQRD